jgi:hypothetical protein
MRTELLAADVDELIREAQGEARAAVKARLRAQFEDALLGAVEARLAAAGNGQAARGVVGDTSVRAVRGATGDAPVADPRGAGAERAGEPGPAPETGEGLWLYGVTARGEAPDIEGVADPHRPRAITAAGLTAMVSTVPLGDFGEQGLKRNLNDVQWLEQVARAHERVLDSALEEAPLIPMRLCTIYRTEEQIQALLAERREQFTEALAALEGRGEWGVKVTADRERAAARLRERDDEHRAAGVGGSYLGRKQQELRLRDEVDAALDAAVQESHARLEEWAVASQLLPPQRSELSGRSGEMVLNGAYLVDDERLDGFRTVIAELGRQYGGDKGLAFELTGPWPPYNFVGDSQ